MALKKFTYLCTLWLCVAASKYSKLPSITNKHFIKDCIDAHNKWRGQVSPTAADMKYMKWDGILAKLAKEGADKCKFEHRNCLGKPYGCNKHFEFIGENIWLGDLSGFTPEAAVSLWFNESLSYDFENASCSKVCGHYTQVVWASSYKVGCSATFCPHLGESSTVVFVCDYGPGGNFGKKHPYTKGASCSLCSEEELCTNKLCRTSKIVLPDKSKAEKLSPKSSQWIVCSVFSLGFVLLKMF